MTNLALLLTMSAVTAGVTPGAVSLDWMLGCWASSDEASREVWVRGIDGSLLGFAVDVSDGEISFYEVLQISTKDDGGLIYGAHPMGRTPTPFKAIELSDSSVVFVNPEHDFPQRIAYRRVGNTLIATISALDGESPRRFEKSRCDQTDDV